MHQPRPHGLHVTGGELTADDSAAIELLARRLTNIKQTSDLPSLRMVRALPDDSPVKTALYDAMREQAGKLTKIAQAEPAMKELLTKKW